MSPGQKEASGAGKHPEAVEANRLDSVIATLSTLAGVCIVLWAFAHIEFPTSLGLLASGAMMIAEGVTR